METFLLIVSLFYMSGAFVLSLTNYLVGYFSMSKTMKHWSKFWGVIVIAYGLLYLGIFYEIDLYYGVFYWAVVIAAFIKITALSNLLAINIPHNGIMYKVIVLIALFVSMFLPIGNVTRIVIFTVPIFLVYTWASYVFLKSSTWIRRSTGLLALMISINIFLYPWVLQLSDQMVYGFIILGVAGLFYGLSIIGIYFEMMMNEQSVLKQELYYLSYHDVLTGLNNRAYFEQQLIELESVEHPMAMIVLDLNNLKEINDTYGHLQGDLVIQKVAEIIHQKTDDTMVSVRFGGDEFIIIMQGDEESSKAFVKDLIATCQETEVDNIRLDVAVGLAHRSKSTVSLETLFEAAEKNMYQNKNRRN